MFHITIIFPMGPTIMPEDIEPVMIKRVEATMERANKIQAAALLLGATNVVIERDLKKS